VARYAYGEDYHDVLRKRLRPVCDLLSDKYSASSRICIDSAPINERYWALRAGIGIKGRNGAVILPSKGSYVFLSELLTSLEVEPDVPSDDTCCGCEKCIKSCPTGALCEDGTIDSRKCINYLTIEHKGAFTDEQLQVLSSSPYRHIYGCEICQEVCPYNQKTPFGEIAEFHLSEQIENLDTESVLKMNEYDFRKMFSKSPVKRAKFEGLKRNVQAYCDIRKR
jgi:epoxyqueuosine reductase